MLVTHLQKLFYVACVFSFSALFSLQAQTDSYHAGPYSCPRATALTPVWGKLVVSGNIVSCYYGTGLTTPTSWLPIGSPQTINFLNNPLLVGIFITAHNAGALSSGTIDNVSITPAPTYQLQDQDIGAPKLMGSANLISGVWSLAGSGADIWATSDQFNFQPWLVTGNCTIICRVTSISSGDIWQKIGIMVRDGYNSGSDYAMFCATYGMGVDFQYRTSFNNNGDVVKYVAPPAPGVTSGVAIGTGLIGTVEGPYPLHN